MKGLWVLPDSWQWSNMGAISEVVAGGTPSTQVAANFGGDIPWLTPADLSGFENKHISRGARQLTQRGLDESSAKMIPQGSVLFTSRAPIGYVAIAANPLSTNQGFKNFVLGPDMVPSYCYYYLLSATALAQGLASGTTFLELSAKKARQIPIPIAPKEEQRRIADILDSLFEDLATGVATLERGREKLRLYRASVLKAAVEGDLTADWRSTHPDAESASALLQRILVERRARWEQRQLRTYAEKGKTPPKNWKAKYKEPIGPELADLPPLPHGWCWATVAQCAYAIQYGSSAKTDDDSSGIPVLRMGNLSANGSIILDGLKYLPICHPTLADLYLEASDLLFNRTNSIDLVGKTATYMGEPSPATFASYLIRIRLLDGLNPRLLMYTLNSYWGKRWIRRVASQTVGQANVNGTKLSAFTFPLPPQPEQERLVSIVDEQVHAIDALDAQIVANMAATVKLRQAILHRAFSGKLVPQDPKDEPATELLKRIAAQ